MKVIYKTIVLNEEMSIYEYMSHEPCCEDMELAVKAHVVSVSNGNKVVLREQDSYDHYMSDYDISIKFCPFCGVAIDFVEGKKVKRVQKERKIRAVPARTEKQWVEVPYEEGKGDG